MKRPAGLTKISKSAEKLDDFLASVADAGRNVSKAAQGIERVIKTNEADVQPAIADLRQVAKKLNDTFDPKTQDALKTGIERFSSAAARLDSGIAQIDPVLKDLGAPVNHVPATDIGQAVRRINMVAADLELLTSKLRDGRGGLNTDGSLQKLLTQAELHDNLNRMAVAANQALVQLKAVLNSLRGFRRQGLARSQRDRPRGVSIAMTCPLAHARSGALAHSPARPPNGRACGVRGKLVARKS